MARSVSFRSNRLDNRVLGFLAAVLLLWPAPALRAQTGGDQPEAETRAEEPPAAEAPEAGPAAPVAGARSMEDDFADFLHYTLVGRFDVANSYATALLGRPDLDPVALLKLTDKYRNSMTTLIAILNNAKVGENARKILDVIHQGELAQRRDSERIRGNIEKLGGDPQTEYNAIQRLKESGEYAIPWMLEALRDPSASQLHPRIVRALPQIGKDAVNPLVIALSMEDNVVRQFVIRALGKIGYPQALPYLKRILEKSDTPPEIKSTVMAAIQQITEGKGDESSTSAAAMFLDLAGQYYENRGSVRADPEGEKANVWYWKDNMVQPTAVPRLIFADIMCMRCCESALQINPDMPQAVAYWLAANIRREARLGLNVESAEDAPEAADDPTRPVDFPRSIYFTQSAGPAYAQQVLQHGVADRDAAVALGAIAALRVVAGESSLVGGEDAKQPLVQALWFPDLVVRIKAGLVLGNALPKNNFANSENVVPVLAEAIVQTGRRFVLVVEPDDAARNRIMDDLRDDQTQVLGESHFLTGLNRARKEFPTLDVIFLATDVSGPDLQGAVAELRKGYENALTPVVLLTKRAQATLAKTIARSDERIGETSDSADGEMLRSAWADVAKKSGRLPLEPEQASDLALETAQTLRRIAIDRATVYDHRKAADALIQALGGTNEPLRIAAASVLAFIDTAAAQEAIATAALDASNSHDLRTAAFGSLAESAKRNGRLLGGKLIDSLIDFALHEPDLSLRTAASQALGALDLPSNKAREVILEFAD